MKRVYFLLFVILAVAGCKSCPEVSSYQFDPMPEKPVLERLEGSDSYKAAVSNMVALGIYSARLELYIVDMLWIVGEIDEAERNRLAEEILKRIPDPYPSQ